MAESDNAEKPPGSTGSRVRQFGQAGLSLVRTAMFLRGRSNDFAVAALDRIVSRLAQKTVSTSPEAIVRRKKVLSDGNREARFRAEEARAKAEAPPPADEEPVREDVPARVRIVPRGLGQAFVTWKVPPTSSKLQVRITEADRTVIRASAESHRGEIFLSVPPKKGPFSAHIEDSEGQLASSEPQLFPSKGVLAPSNPFRPRDYHTGPNPRTTPPSSASSGIDRTFGASDHWQSPMSSSYANPVGGLEATAHRVVRFLREYPSPLDLSSRTVDVVPSSSSSFGHGSPPPPLPQSPAASPSVDQLLRTAASQQEEATQAFIRERLLHRKSNP